MKRDLKKKSQGVLFLLQYNNCASTNNNSLEKKNMQLEFF